MFPEIRSLFTEVQVTCQYSHRHCGIGTALAMVNSGAMKPMAETNK